MVSKERSDFHPQLSALSYEKHENQIYIQTGTAEDPPKIAPPPLPTVRWPRDPPPSPAPAAAMPPAPNYEFQEWWNRERQRLAGDGPAPTTSLLPAAAGEDKRPRNARQLSHLLTLKLAAAAAALARLLSSSSALALAAGRRISSAPGGPARPTRLYRAIRAFLAVSLALLAVEVVAYWKGWHFRPPAALSASSAEELLGFLYGNWVTTRAEYLAPPLQGMTNLCTVLFLIQSVDRIVLVMGCFWIKFRRLKPVARFEYAKDDDLEAADGGNEYPMVLLQIPMCNEREVS